MDVFTIEKYLGIVPIQGPNDLAVAGFQKTFGLNTVKVGSCLQSNGGRNNVEPHVRGTICISLHPNGYFDYRSTFDRHERDLACGKRGKVGEIVFLPGDNLLAVGNIAESR